MNHIELQGTHRQAGLQWGRRLLERKKHILSRIPFQITAERAEYAKACLPVYQRYYPEILTELEGLAAGQCCDVQMLHTVLFSMYAMPPACHCSCFAMAHGNEVVFGRNSDFLTALEEDNTNALYRLTDGAYAFMGHTTSFVQMEDGVNVHGLAVGLTSVYPTVRQPGFNAGMLVRYLLEKCRTTREALTRLRQLPIGSAQTLTIADAAGEMAVVECNAEEQQVVPPSAEGCRYVCATNLFHSRAMQKYNCPLDDDWFAERRCQTMRGALKQAGECPVQQFAKRLLSGAYGFICQYDRSTGRDTVWSVVYDLSARQIWRSEANPSRCGYRRDDRLFF